MKLSNLVNELEEALRDVATHKAGLAAAETRIRGLKERISGLDAGHTSAPHANGVVHKNGAEKKKRTPPDYDRSRRALEFLKSRGGFATIAEFAKHDKSSRAVAGQALLRLSQDKSTGVSRVSKGRYKLESKV